MGAQTRFGQKKSSINVLLLFAIILETLKYICGRQVSELPSDSNVYVS